uniref:Myelin gene regulatory factor C-terminal domain-containing protein n=1 Tax=Crocodylus porosus TaxID=8502 RepID=A0A7M4EH35_CROPO
FFYSVLTISTIYALSMQDQGKIKGSQSPIFRQVVKLLFTISPSIPPVGVAPEVNFCDILPCDNIYCCPIHQTKRKVLSYQKMMPLVSILETQQKIDSRYCSKRLQCSTMEPLIVFQCKVTIGNICGLHSRPRNEGEAVLETQGCQHIWILPVASWYDSAYHFRVAAPDLADCTTDPNYAGMFFTDYYFYFYRQCN